MKIAIKLLALGGAALAASLAWAHSDTHKPGSATPAPAVASASASASTSATATAPAPQDARSYFTDLELITQDGRKVRFYSDMLAGRTVVINVIYTNCQDACPLITQQLNEVRQRVPELFGKQVFFISLSSDPKRDTPKALKQFAKKQNADVEGWTFLTGRQENIDHILKKLGQYSEDVEGHSTLLIAGNVPAKRWSKILANAPSAAIAARLSVLAGATDAALDKP